MKLKLRLHFWLSQRFSIKRLSVKKNKTSLKKLLCFSLPTAFAALSISIAFNAPVYSIETGGQLGPSGNPEIHKRETEITDKLKKAKAEESSDLLYDLARACFDLRDYDRAAHYMLQSLTFEDKLNRPEQRSKTHVALAICYAVQKKPDEALAQYRQALALAEKANLVEYQAMIVDSMGTLALKAGKLEEADSLFQRSFELGAKEKSVPAQINALVNKATIQRALKQHQKALDLLQKALDITKSAEQDRLLGNALLNLARVQHDMGELQASLVSYKKAIEVFKADLEVESEANACWSLAETLFDLERISEARDYFNEAYEALKDEPDSDLKLDALIGLGSAEADLGHTDKAQELHKKAFEMAEKTKRTDKQLDSLLQLGYDNLLSGSTEAALYRFTDGEKLIAKGAGDAKRKGTFFIAIGRCYKTLGETESAQKYYEEALQIFDAIGDKPSKAQALNSLAVLALDNRNWADFEVYTKAAKDIYSGLESKRELAVMDYNFGQYMLMQHKYPEAKESYQQALESFKAGGDRVAEGRVLGALGLLEYFLNRPQQALQFYEQAQKVANETGSKEALWESHLGLGKCYKRLGLTDMALSHLMQAVENVEKERGQLTKDSFKTNNLNERTDSFHELIDLFVRLNRPYDALAIAEKGRARAFLDMLSGRKTGPAIETFSTPLASNPGLPSANPIATNEKKAAPALVAMAEPGTRAVSVLPKTAEVMHTSAMSDTNASAPDINEIKTLVKNSKSTVVEFFVLADKIIVWVVDPDSTVHMLPPIAVTKQQLDEKVSLAYQSITRHPKNQAEVAVFGKQRQDMMRELYDLLLKPVEPYLPKNDQDVVTIIPHATMFMIPFAALMSEDNKFLIEKHTLAYVPAIGVLRATQKLDAEFAKQPDKLLAFGNPITKKIEFLGTLPFSEKEVQNVAALFGADKSVVKIGQDADKKTFFALAPGFAEVHLATHGLVDEEHPMQSSLILAPTGTDDGLLTVKDILSMNQLKAKLVVLSACQTGRGKITGDGVVGLSRAFIIAGTPSVLVSQWNVDDVITEFQMKEFYKGYLARAGKSKSLRDAQLATIKLLEGGSKPSALAAPALRANPRFWAAFQMIGESI